MTIGNIIDSIKEKEKNDEVLTSEDNKFKKMFSSFFKKLINNNKHLFNISKKMGESFKKRTDSSNDIILNSLLLTSKIGYFLPMDMNISDVSCIDEDKILIHLRNNYNNIKNDLLNFFKGGCPYSALNESFELYEIGKYRGSISIMIPIIDSFYYNTGTEPLFELLSNNKNNKPRREKKFRNLNIDSLTDFMLQFHKFDIVKSINGENSINRCVDLINSGKMINRHLILHGRVFDYGSESNFFRVFSLLYFLVEIEQLK